MIHRTGGLCYAESPIRWSAAGQRCHAVAISVPTGVENQHVAAQLGRVDELGSLDQRLWLEQLHVAESDPDAASRLRRELWRPLGSDSRVRAVLLRFKDGRGRLVVVGDRSTTPGSTLHALASALVGQSVPPTLQTRSIRSVPWSGDGPDWGLPRDDRDKELAVLLDIDAEALRAATATRLVAALAVVCSRYDGSDFASLALSVETADSDSIQERRFDISVADATVADLIRRSASALSQGMVAGSPVEPPFVSVVVRHRREGVDYLPTLSPFNPVTVVLEVEGENPVTCCAMIDARRIHPEVAATLLRSVARVVIQLADSTRDRPVAELGLLATADAGRMLRLGRTGAPSASLASTIDALVDLVAAANPDRPAVTDERTTLSYRELIKSADSSAQALRALGVRPGDRVGVCMDRTASCVVVLLAALKAGAAYVPVDFSSPDERLRNIMRDSGANLLVVDRPLTSAPVRVVSSESLVVSNLDPSGQAVSDTHSPYDAAYVIYTSGSTGKPKGVIIPHRNVQALVNATGGDMGLGSADVWSWFHSSAFDFSVWEIWTCLLTGGHLRVVPYLTTRSPADFREFLLKTGVTVLSQTPTAFAGLVEEDALGTHRLGVRLVVLGGEAVNPATVARWFEHNPGSACCVVNMYGITETTVHATLKKETLAGATSGDRSVGHAVPGWGITVRDKSGRLLPEGVAGEICLTGAGLATGYLGRPKLTAERFIFDPQSGERLYRSGDRGRLRLDGSLDHLGRLDRQVKLRGFRIELGEIEVALATAPGVMAAVVVLNDDPDDGPTLDAFVVGGDGQDLKSSIRNLLPDYMIPSTITTIDRLPLNQNGKVDRTKLVRPSKSQRLAPSAAESSDEPVRQVLAAFRATVDESMSQDDDFFDAGGNSLLAVKLVRLVQDLGWPSAGVRDIYESGTAARLATLLESRKAQTEVVT